MSRRLFLACDSSFRKETDRIQSLSKDYRQNEWAILQKNPLFYPSSLLTGFKGILL